MIKNSKLLEELKYLKNKIIPPKSLGNLCGKNAIYITLPKCANTTIKKEIRKITWGDPRLTKKQLKRISQGKFIFTFVRNPYDRFLSLYLDKVKNFNKDNDYIRGVCRNIVIKKNITFKEFAELASLIPDECADPHFKSMTELIKESGLKPSFIGKIENFENDWNILCKILGIKNEGLGMENKTKHKPWQEYYTPELKEKVYQRYKEDFINFGYKK